MQRILTVLACVCGCSFLGLRLADRLRGRAAALRDMRTGLRALVHAVSYSNRTLAGIAEDIAIREGLPFWGKFSERLGEGRDAGEAWRDALDDASRSHGALAALTQRDRALLEAFSTTLGKTDRRSQAENGRMTLEALSMLIEGADAVYTQKGRVYRTLGVFLGLGVGILLW